MPNDCINYLSITDLTQDQWRDLASSFHVRTEDCQQDFLKTFYPEPDWQNTPSDNGQLPSAPDKNGITRFSDGTQDLRWYEWRNKHWGTKWDVYSCCNDWENAVPSDEFSANFCPAWSPLNEECMAVLSRKFPGSLLTNYYEEGGMDFFGVTVAKDGEVRNFCDFISKYRETFVRQQFPDLDARLEEEGLDLEDDLDEFFWDNCNSGEFTDFLYDSLDSVLEKMVHQIEDALSDLVVAA